MAFKTSISGNATENFFSFNGKTFLRTYLGVVDLRVVVRRVVDDSDVASLDSSIISSDIIDVHIAEAGQSHNMSR